MTRMHQQHLLPLLGLTLLASQLPAQVAPAPTASAPSPGGKKNDIIELSPFQVDASKDTGYYSAQTLAGGRLNTNLKDIASSVQVVTKEFMEDIGATSLDEVLAYTTNTDAMGPLSSYSAVADPSGSGVLDQSEARQDPASANRVRGLAAPTRTTNYFESFIPFDSYNSDRVDINRGANSFLFGLGSPGGIVNNNLAKASFKDSAEINFQLSTENFEDNTSKRAAVNVNKVLVEKTLAIRLAATEDRKEFTQRPAYTDTSRKYAAIQWKPLKKGRVAFNANYETGKIKAVPVDRLAPLESLSLFLNDPYGTRWKGVGNIPNAAGRRLQDPYGNILANRAGPPVGNVTYLGRDINGVLLTTAQYDSFIKRNGWASVYDGTEDANGISGRGVHTGWTGNRVRRGSRWFDPNNDLTGFTQSVLVQNLDISDLSGPEFAGFVKAGLNNYDVFDYRRNLLTGTIDNYTNDFDRKMASLEAVSPSGNFGVELSYARETFTRDSFVAVPTPEIDIDVNYSFPIGPNATFGPTNPNFGRLYFYAPSSNQTINNDSRETIRATAFAKFDFAKKFDRGMLKWLGRHTLTGLYDDHTLNQQRFVDKPVVYGNDADIHLSSSATIFQRQWSGFFYISNPQLAAFENPSFGLADFRAHAVDPRVSVKFPANVQIPVAYLNAGTPGQLAATDGNGDGLYTPTFAPFSGELLRTTVESYAASMQSFFLKDHLVTNLGWRTDKTKILRNALPPLNPDGTPIRDSAGFNLDNIKARVVEDSTLSYGLVLKVPRKWTPERMSVALHYGASQNFVPNPSGFTFTGQSVPNGEGTTKEMGVTISLMNDKLVARINRYKGTLKNENYRPISAGMQNLGNAHIARGFQGMLLDMDQYDRNRDGKFDLQVDPTDPAGTRLIDPDANNNGFLDEIEPGGALYVPGARYQPLSEFITIFNAYDAFYNDWARTTAEHVFVPGTIPGSFVGAVATANSGLSEVLTDTVDLNAQGWELELTYNPTERLRLSVNVAQQEATRTNIAPRLGELIEQLVAIHNLVPTGNQMVGSQRVTDRLTRPLLGVDYGPGTTAGFFLRGAPGRAYFQQSALAGSNNPEVREYRVNALGNYSFTEGRFKGVNVGGAYRWQDKAAIGNKIYIDPTFNIAFQDVTKPYFDDGSEFVDLWIGYRRKIWNGRVNWRIQLNVRNVFADKDPITVTVQPDGSTARSSIPVPRQFQLSNTFGF